MTGRALEIFVSDSQVLFHRAVQDRVSTLAPFLTLDHDPYVVVSNDRLYWIQDAYTTAGEYPYSEPDSQTGVNYIRNSVKVVVDAYTGAVDFYTADPGDPVLRTYSRIFPGVFSSGIAAWTTTWASSKPSRTTKAGSASTTPSGSGILGPTFADSA